MGKRKSYGDADAVCPFYRSAEGTDICCEGTSEGMRLAVRFQSGEKMREYKSDFCDCMRTYANCPLFAAHDE